MLGQVFGQYAAYTVPAYGVSAAVMLGMIVATRLRYRRRLRDIAALENQGVARRAAPKAGSVSSVGGKTGDKTGE
ncbi:MAG: heme exporter protein CcmD [Nitratireductor sp.]|nr:heme exporter protein CcmD [Nitratireductor sp.]